MVGLLGTLLTTITPRCNRAGIYLENSTIGNRQPSGVTPVGALFTGIRRLVRYHRPSARCRFIVGVLTKRGQPVGFSAAFVQRRRGTTRPPRSVMNSRRLTCPPLDLRLRDYNIRCPANAEAVAASQRVDLRWARLHPPIGRAMPR